MVVVPVMSVKKKCGKWVVGETCAVSGVIVFLSKLCEGLFFISYVEIKNRSNDLYLVFDMSNGTSYEVSICKLRLYFPIRVRKVGSKY